MQNPIQDDEEDEKHQYEDEYDDEDEDYDIKDNQQKPKGGKLNENEILETDKADPLRDSDSDKLSNEYDDNESLEHWFLEQSGIYDHVKRKHGIRDPWEDNWLETLQEPWESRWRIIKWDLDEKKFNTIDLWFKKCTYCNALFKSVDAYLSKKDEIRINLIRAIIIAQKEVKRKQRKKKHEEEQQKYLELDVDKQQYDKSQKLFAQKKDMDQGKKK